MPDAFSSAEVSAALTALRREPGHVTNLFLAESEWSRLALDGVLSTTLSARGVAMVHRDGSLERVYFAAAACSDLTGLLAGLPSGGVRQVVDVVGARDDVRERVAAILSAGFARHATFQRMSGDGGEMGGRRGGLALDAPDECEPARASDAAEIHELMRANLDPISERIPEAADVESSVSDGRVLVVRIDGQIAAYLVFAVRGWTTTLRYWFVRPGFRGRALGRALLDRYLASQSTCRRFLLWVDEENSRAAQAYERAGYRADGLVDVILRRDR